MNQYDLTDENIQLILKRYKNKQIKDKERYQVNKTNPEFMMKNRQRTIIQIINILNKYTMKSMVN